MPEETWRCDQCGDGKWSLLCIGKVRCLSCGYLQPDVVVGITKPNAATWGAKKVGKVAP
jgi:uncharacterized Zn finger protein